MVADNYLDQCRLTDWHRMSLEEARERFIQLTDLYDFKGKADQYCRDVMDDNKFRTAKHVAMFAFNIAYKGHTIKLHQEFQQVK